MYLILINELKLKMADFVGDYSEPSLYEDDADGYSYCLAHDDEYVDDNSGYCVSPTSDDDYESDDDENHGNNDNDSDGDIDEVCYFRGLLMVMVMKILQSTT